jgi:hypothetical protein
MVAMRIMAAALLSVVAGSYAAAWVPPKMDVHDAMMKGRIAFWARVKGAELLEDRRLETIGRLRFEVTECFYGACQAGEEMALRYRAYIIKEQVETIPFVAVGGEALVILGSPDALKHDGIIDGEGPDHVFFSEPPQIGKVLAEMGSGKRRLVQVSRQWQSQDVTLDELRTWAKERSVLK